ncbi:MAG: sulfotransferase domain-containing protein [Bacteroidota bacterium]
MFHKEKKKLQQIKNSIAFYYNCQFNRKYLESVYFYTFHKCASTLFSGFVLKNIIGLENIDFASEIYSGKRSIKKKLKFYKRGIIYGSLRISSLPRSSADKGNSIGRLLMEPIIKKKFLRDKTVIILIRDPRDILVSAYYSFGFTHGTSPVEDIAQRQKTNRKYISNLTLDEYVLDAASSQVRYFKLAKEVSIHSKHSVVLKYEDLINDFDKFSAQLTKHLSFKPSTIEEIFQRSRPKGVEDIESHRRSGATGGFRNKLKEETVIELNKLLRDTLSLYGYKE